ncbi:PQQ-binding-like beta-propeller repeat protein [Natrarchaeobaculum aegyptiacum]|uniref:outer membrane protein assembly factor BamB family protein n=1 Tax=Natrarchaeobaculum aegyptiacum TaxID=745377 RepID=UPI000A3D742E|nr:PQQ-binding-like beta-propeller repeat protein [Natrarchaeobaculum aegyptiacum]
MTARGPRSSRRRTLQVASLAIGGGLAGCMQPLLEEAGDGGQASTDDEPATDSTGTDTEPQPEADSDESDEGDTIEAVDLSPAWDVDGLNRVFVDDGQFVGRNSGDVTIVSWDGDVVWESQSGDPDGYSEWPNDGRGFARTDDYVFVHYLSWGIEEEYPACVYVFDADTGELEWRHDTGADRVYGMDAVGDRLYYAARPFDRDETESPIRAYDLDDREIVWESRFSTNDPWSLTVHDGHVYATTGRMRVLDAASGDLVAEHGNWFAFHRENETLYFEDGDTIGAYDLVADERTMEVSVDHGYSRDLTVVANRAYVSDTNGYLSAIDLETGTVRWEERLDGSLSGRPIVDSGIVWAYDATSVLWGLDADDGSVLVRRSTEADGDDRVSALDGRVFVPDPYYTAYDVGEDER